MKEKEMVDKKERHLAFFFIQITLSLLHCPWRGFELLDLVYHICQWSNIGGLLLFAMFTKAEAVQEQRPFEQLDAEGWVHAFGAGL